MKNKKPYDNYDHPNTLQNDEATVLWVIGMVFGPILCDNFIMVLLIWVLFTYCWYKHITRHERS